MTLTIKLILGLLLATQAGLCQFCSWPPNLTTTTITYTWGAYAGNPLVVATGFPSFGPLETAIDNWNSQLNGIVICNDAAIASSTNRYYQSWSTARIYVNYAYISSPSPTQIIRGSTDLNGATINPVDHRIMVVHMTINNLVTAGNAITEVFAHEIGHTFGLNDCNRCGLNSTVMEVNDTVSSVNSLIGRPGPTNNDIHWVTTVATDYVCPYWSYPPCQP